MKIIITSFLLLALSLTAFAQTPKLEYQIAAGTSAFTGPQSVEQFYQRGFHIAFAVEYPLTKRWNVGGNFNFNWLGLDEQAVKRSASVSPNPLTVIDGGNYTLFELLGVASYHLWPRKSKLNVYAVGAAGAVLNRITDTAVLIPGQPPSSTPGSTKVKFAVAPGLGVKLRISEKIGVFFEGRFNVIVNSGSQITYFPIKAGILF